MLMLGNFGSNTLSVVDFGATGNGTTDDTNAINSCLTSAHSSSKNIFFPPGVYLCNKENGQGNILIYDASGMNNITIFGNGATILTTKDSATTQLSISATTNSYGLMISNLFFQNTHGKITGVTGAIFLAGTSGQHLDSTYLLHCKFAGFSNAVGGQGINGWKVLEDTFQAPHGHDDAQQNTNPAVHLSAFDNANGFVTNWDVERCVASGYTGPLPLNCKRPMDGFAYGTAYGIVIMGNQTSNYSEEHILLQPVNTTPGTTATALIQGNIIDQTLPPGCVQDNGVPHKINYGVRADISNVSVTSNIFKNFTYGIITKETDYSSSLTPKNFSFQGNHFYAPNATDTTYSIQKSISITGSTNLIPGVIVSGNIAHNQDTASILISATTGAISSGNRYSPGN